MRPKDRALGAHKAKASTLRLASKRTLPTSPKGRERTFVEVAMLTRACERSSNLVSGAGGVACCDGGQRNRFCLGAFPT